MGGGCFWCLDALYRPLAGVHDVICGYAGGSLPDPDYQAVCSGRSGHAEVVRIVFDPSEISFADLLDMFFFCHDPTTLNRQGHDIGSQYRSIIVCQDADQRRIAESAIAAENESGRWPDPVVTELVYQAVFHPAEDYHQDYFTRNPDAGYCQAIIAPKRERFLSRYRTLLGK